MNKEKDLSEFEYRSFTTICDLVGIPDQEIKLGRDIYTGLANTVFCIASLDNVVTVDFPKLTGEYLAAMRHFAAPSKRFADKFDMKDTNMDWRDLFTSKDQRHVERLAIHRRIPGWSYLERDWKDILDFMNKGMDRFNKNIAPDDRSDIVQPTAVLRHSNGRWQWDLDTSTTKWSWLSTLFVAGYAPEITSTWGQRSHYSDPLDKGRGTQDMGPTQAIPLALWKRDSLIQSNLVQRILKVSGK